VGITDTPVMEGNSTDSGGSGVDESGIDGSLPDGPAGGESSVVGPGNDDAARESGITAGDGPAADTGGGGAPHDATAEAPPGDAGADVSQQHPVDAGADQASADSGGCSAQATRCGAAGREVCMGSAWQSSPCPVDKAICSAGQCTVRGPTMVQVGGFFIDSTEVTVAQYQEFLAAKGTDTSGQPAVCAWNKAYRDTTIPLSPSSWPMTNVDWCDALAYCTWAGKHLCGKIGGGPVASADALTASKSQWFLACGGAGGSSHPSNSDMCNSNGGFGSLAPVATFPGCEGFYPGIFDMEGNAAEWVDSCDSTDAGPTDTCHLLGGSYIDSKSYCTESFDQARNSIADPFGFRCCGG
jgi:formylglycine-generating enzyme required for sulfatase activity